MIYLDLTGITEIESATHTPLGGYQRIEQGWSVDVKWMPTHNHLLLPARRNQREVLTHDGFFLFFSFCWPRGPPDCLLFRKTSRLSSIFHYSLLIYRSSFGGAPADQLPLPDCKLPDGDHVRGSAGWLLVCHPSWLPPLVDHWRAPPAPAPPRRRDICNQKLHNIKAGFTVLYGMLHDCEVHPHGIKSSFFSQHGYLSLYWEDVTPCCEHAQRE